MFLQNELNGSSVVFFQNTWWHIGQCAGLYAGSSGSVDGVIFFCFGANQFTVKVSGDQKAVAQGNISCNLFPNFVRTQDAQKFFLVNLPLRWPPTGFTLLKPTISAGLALMTLIKRKSQKGASPLLTTIKDTWCFPKCVS